MRPPNKNKLKFFEEFINQTKQSITEEYKFDMKRPKLNHFYRVKHERLKRNHKTEKMNV